MTIEMEEVMWTEQSPDIYGGDSCNQIIPRWKGHCAGDMDGDVSQDLSLIATHFPPGTKVVVSVPLCPECGESSDMALNYRNGAMKNCTCGYDWNQYARDTYS